MTQTISIGNAEHYTWGGACDGWRLLQSAGLGVIQERVPAGAGEVMHHHQRAQQFFFILDGEGTMQFEHEAIRLPAGRGLEVPAGVRHRFCNLSGGDVTFLVVSVPPSHGDRIDS